MRRREFITLCGGVAAWPIALQAQSTERVRVLGILNILGPDDPEAKARTTVFEQTLQQLGWAVGRDLKIETREVGSDLDLLRHGKDNGSINYYNWFAYEFWRFVLVQQVVGKLAQTAIDFPPMQPDDANNVGPERALRWG